MAQEQRTVQETILVVNPDEPGAASVAAILGKHGYQVTHVGDLAGAMHQLEVHGPELLILDSMASGMDCLGTLQTIRQRFPGTGIIVLCGEGDDDLAHALLGSGEVGQIRKPFNTWMLLDRVESALKLRALELYNRELTVEREQLLYNIQCLNLEMEARVQEKSETLHKVQQEIVQAEKLIALGHLSAGMAHEIRNPLNSINLLVQLLKTGLPVHETNVYLDKILKEIERIDSIVRRLLETAKRPRYQISKVYIGDVLEVALEGFGPQFQARNIHVQRDFLMIPPPIQADPGEIEQIFTNQIANSISAMPDGGKLCVELQHDEREITVRVSDSGVGIPMEHLSRVFDPFFTTKEQGTGLGLSVVLRIVKTYNGRIEVERSDSSGTTFCTRLPMAN